MTAGSNVRSLGLAMQLIAVITIAEPLLQVVFLLLGRDADFFHPALLAPVGLCAVQLVAGWVIATRPPRARAAAATFAIAAIVLTGWTISTMLTPADTAFEHGSHTFEIIGAITGTCLWPLVVVVAVWRSKAPALPGRAASRSDAEFRSSSDAPDDLQRRPEAGGLLAAYGGTVLVFAGLHVATSLLLFDRLPGGYFAGFVVPELFDVAIGVLAIRAASELVMATQQGRSRFTTLLRLAVIGYPVITVAQIFFFIVGNESIPASAMVALAAVSITTKLAPLGLLRVHTRRLSPQAIEVGTPDPEPAIGALAWVMLWFCAVLGGTLPLLFDRIDGESLVAAVIMVVYILASATAFAAARRGTPKRRMWAAIVPAGLAFVVLALTVFFGIAESGPFTPQQPFNLLVAGLAVPTALARYSRPSLQGRRGLGSVFE